MKKTPENRNTHQSVGLRAMVRRGDLKTVDCPSREVLKHVTSLWGVLILLALMDGTLRFSELKKRVPGVSEKMLAQTLQYLEADGFVNRVSFPVVPPRVEYSLSELGNDAAVQVTSLTDWIETHLHRVMDHRRANGPEVAVEERVSAK